MTRLFLASALAVGAAMYFASSPTAPASSVSADLFGIEDLNASAAAAAGLLQVGAGGELLIGAKWQAVELETWAFDEQRRSFQAMESSWVSPRDAEPEDFGTSLNAELVRRGLAIGHVTADSHLAAGRMEALAAAASEAQAQGAGLWAQREPSAAAPPFRQDPNNPGAWLGSIAGVALPMHHKEPHQTYAWELAEIAELGAQWVNLIVATRIDKADSVHVPHTSERTPSDERIRATIEAAHALGLGVQLMPIVLIANPGPKDWRGTLAPKDPGQFWRSYDRWICHMADLASTSGAEILCIGSELASLESDQSAWLRLIANVRMRYRGQLTYSANWDHFAQVPFWGQLDFASMTAYFTLCADAKGAAADFERGDLAGTDQFKEPALDDAKPGTEDSKPDTAQDLRRAAALRACVQAGWQAALFEAWRLSRISKLPVLFSEVGVPSVEGALAGPWDYTLDAPVDLEAQRLAFELFREALVPGTSPAEGFHGAFLYDYWGPGGPDDKTYSPRGKPALAEWRRILADLAAAPR